MRKKRIRPVLLWLLAVTIGTSVLWLVVAPAVRNWRVERAISRFEAKPSQARANVLVDLLKTHAASDNQGKRALALLLRPNVVTRESYPTGQIAMVSLEQRFVLEFGKVFWQERVISINDMPGVPSPGIGDRVAEKPYLGAAGAYEQPGVYPVSIHIRWGMGIERADRLGAIINRLRLALPQLRLLPSGWTSARTYECDFTTTTEIEVVAKDEAEQVQVTSSPDLDKAMKARFAVARPSPMMQYSTGSGNRWIRGPGQLTYTDLPAAAAFGVVLRLSDGREIATAGTHVARAGDSGVVNIPLWDLKLEQPGRYEATLVLTPAPDAAYRDPAIKVVWNGTLEFPISFRIDANAPPGWPPQP
ncbi:MAG: hypothetical protein KBE65_18490 [Phycisphaerae bacterium]|nr:hypothetical protein [Phycisphaerae bacterium]